jgi:hypothetical protein
MLDSRRSFFLADAIDPSRSVARAGRHPVALWDAMPARPGEARGSRGVVASSLVFGLLESAGLELGSAASDCRCGTKVAGR